MAVETVAKTIGTSQTFSSLQLHEDGGPADYTTAERWSAGTFTGTFQQGEAVSGTGLTSGKFLDSDGSSYVTFGIITGNSATLVTLTGTTSGATCIVSAKTFTGIIWQGQLANEEFTGAGTRLTVTGSTTSSTAFYQLKCKTGASFCENANVRTNALIYNASNGAGIRTTSGSYVNTLTIIQGNSRFNDLQVQGPNGNAGIAISWSTSTNVTVSKCILSARQTASHSNGPGVTYINCLMEVRGAGSLFATNATGTSRLEFCTLVRGTNGGSPGTISYGTLTVENTAIFNFTSGFATGTSGVLAGGFNATDFSSAPGSSNQVSLTYASQVVSTSADWRAKAGGSMVNGTPATSYATDDISFFARNATTPTIGCWELASAAVAAAGYPMMMGMN